MTGFVERSAKSWVRLVCRFPWLVLLLALISAGLGLTYTAKHLAINTSIADMLSADLPFRQNLLAIDGAFPDMDREVLVVVEGAQTEAVEQAAASLADALRKHPERIAGVFYPEGLTFFKRNGLLYLEQRQLEDLADRLAEAEPLLAVLARDPSLRGLATVLQSTGQAESERLAALQPALEAMAETVEALNRRQTASLSWQALMQDDAAAAAQIQRRFILVQPVPDYASLAPVADTVAVIEQAAAALNLSQDGPLRLRITGEAVMLQDELVSVRDGIGLVGLISFILVGLLLIAGLRSLRLVLATLVTLLVGLIWTALFAVLAIGQLNIISVAFAVLFIGLSVDFGIHYALRVVEQISAGRGTALAQENAAGGVGGALTLTAVAASIGFLSFLPTDYRGLSELGLISGVGMFIALFANLTLLPAILQLLPPKTPKARAGAAPVALFERLFAALNRIPPKTIVIGALVIGLMAASLLPWVRFDDDPLNLRDPDSPSVATLLDILEDPRVEPYEAKLLVPNLADADALAARLTALPEVAAAVTLSNFVPEDQDDKLAVVDEMSFFLGPVVAPGEWPALPDDTERQVALSVLKERLADLGVQGLAAAGRLAAALTAQPDNESARTQLETALFMWLPDRLAALTLSLEAQPIAPSDVPEPLAARALAVAGQALIRVLPAEDLRDDAARVAFVEAVLAVAPGATGGPVVIVAAGRAVRVAFYQAATLAVVLISLLLPVILRSWRDSALVLAPTVLATLLTTAIAVLIGLPFNFANVIVLPLLFGLGVAGGIHMVLRSRQEGTAAAESSSTPRAVAFSALTTIGSFGALALSKHVGTASMGLLLTIAITMTLVANLIVLPSLLVLVRGMRDSRESGYQ